MKKQDKSKFRIETRAIASLFALGKVAIVAILLSACATESAPTGGAQDETPAELKEARPIDGSVNFREQKIELTFNEFIQNSGFPTTVISPPLEKKPAFGMQGKTLIVRFKSELRDSTTYTINFGDDIKDLNEGNVTDNFTYVFSTGTYIDSQSISGKVVNVADGKAAEGILVMLYPQKALQNDSIKEAVLNMQPSYFAKTDKNGMYQIRNVKADSYKVYALKDGNFNYIYDQPNEQVGFIDSLINMVDTISSRADLLIFTEEGKRAKLENVKSAEAGKLTMEYNGQVRKFKISSDSTEGIIYWKNKEKDSLTIWYSNFYVPAATFYTTANDSILDTTRIELKFINKDTMLTVQKYPLSIINETLANSGKKNISKVDNIQSLYGWLKINFNRPIISIDSSKHIEIIEDSTNNVLAPQVRLPKHHRQTIEFDFERKPETNYSFIVPDSTFQDIFGLWNRAINWKFKTMAKASYGNLKVKITVENTAKHYIINILNDKNELIEEVPMNNAKEKNITINNVLSGNYHITVVEDDNNNGEWDTGNLLKHIQPEIVKELPNTYNLKGGWDLDVEVKL